MASLSLCTNIFHFFNLKLKFFHDFENNCSKNVFWAVSFVFVCVFVTQSYQLSVRCHDFDNEGRCN